MIVMLDGVPGLGKKSILQSLCETDNTIIPMAENIARNCPMLIELYSVTKKESIGTAALAIEFFIFSLWGDVIRQMQDNLQPKKTVIIETSIFWPVIWINIFSPYLEREDIEMLINAHTNMVNRFIKFLIDKDYTLLHIYLQPDPKLKSNFIHVIGGKAFNVFGPFLQNHPDLIRSLDNYNLVKNTILYHAERDFFFGALYKTIQMNHYNEELPKRPADDIAADILQEIATFKKEIYDKNKPSESVYTCYETLFQD